MKKIIIVESKIYSPPEFITFCYLMANVLLLFSSEDSGGFQGEYHPMCNYL